MSAAFRRLWGMPILLGVISATGLIAALVEDGFGDVLSWLTLGLLVVLIVWYWWRPVRA